MTPSDASAVPSLSEREALKAINELRSNIIATQSAGWSNTIYPLVAILNAAGFEVDSDVGNDAQVDHLHCYGGAGGWPGNCKTCRTCNGTPAKSNLVRGPGGPTPCLNTFHERPVKFR
jgi:hypothetical protein